MKQEEDDARVGGQNHLFHLRARGRVTGREAEERGGGVDNRAELRDFGEGREGGERREGREGGRTKSLDDVFDEGGAADDDIHCVLC